MVGWVRADTIPYDKWVLVGRRSVRAALGRKKKIATEEWEGGGGGGLRAEEKKSYGGESSTSCRVSQLLNSTTVPIQSISPFSSLIVTLINSKGQLRDQRMVA